MKLNNLKRTLLASTFGLVGLLGATQVANAQIYREDRQERREDRREERQERREDRRDAARDGYREGLEEGREDARAGRSYNPQGQSEYRRAGGEDTQRERQAFRNRFLQGYREGYYANNRRGNWNNGNWNNGVRQATIQTRNVRVGGRIYRETYRVIYLRNGAAQTQLISRVRIS